MHLVIGTLMPDLVYAEGGLQACPARIVAHGRGGYRVRTHAITADDQQVRLHGLDAGHTAALSADDGFDSVDHREVDGPRPAKVGNQPRHPPALVAVGFGIEFLRHARGRLYLPVMEDPLPHGPGN